MRKLKRYHNLRKRKASFYPTRSFLQQAVDEYLKNGGKISKIVLDDKSYTSFLEKNSNLLNVDEFLLGH